MTTKPEPSEEYIDAALEEVERCLECGVPVDDKAAKILAWGYRAALAREAALKAKLGGDLSSTV